MLWLNQKPDEGFLSRTTIGSEGSLFIVAQPLLAVLSAHHGPRNTDQGSVGLLPAHCTIKMGRVK